MTAQSMDNFTSYSIWGEKREMRNKKRGKKLGLKIKRVVKITLTFLLHFHALKQCKTHNMCVFNKYTL